jgi:hypothetical protein
MEFFVSAHQHKGEPFFKALRMYYRTTSRNPDVVLVDRDWYMHNDKKPRQIVLDYLEKGATIMVYPHSALPPWWYDGLIKIQPWTSCVFVIGEGAKEAMKVIEPSVRVEAVGWPWCPQQEFQRPEKLKNILFAPIHPSGGRLRPEALDANRLIFHELKRVARWTGAKIVIRHIHALNLQGLRPYNRFHFVHGMPDGSTKEIDEADVVIAEGTFMYSAVARGKPTIGINQHLACRANKMCDKYSPHNWEKYGPDLAYPINFEPRKLMEKIELATSGEQSEWRERFIGPSLDPKAFSELVESIWREDKQKQYSVLGGDELGCDEGDNNQ